MNDLYIVEIYGPGPIFLSLTVWDYLHSFYTVNPKKAIYSKVMCYSHSKSLKLVPIGSPYLNSY